MASLEETFEQACKDKVIPGAVLVASNTSGSFKYSKAFGSLSIQDDHPKPLPLDAIFLMASCTKLMTSIAVMQCVERGQVKLDDDVTKILPELLKLDIFTGFDDSEKPIMKKRNNTITLRRLLTHSSGICYAAFDPEVQKANEALGQPKTGHPATVMSRFSAPLIYEPGKGWMYGTSIDWAGKMVERLNNMSLEEFMQKNIWSPLGIKDITFWPDKRPDMQSRLMQMTTRVDDKLEPYDGPSLSAGAEDCLGGQGSYASGIDYIKILHSLLANDEKLLKKETLEQMRTPCLEDEAKAAFNDMKVSRPSIFDFFIGEINKKIDIDFGLGSLVFLEDDPGWRGKGTMHWGGYANLFWFIDWKHDICGFFGTQVVPPGDMQVAKLITLWEKTMHERVKTA